ncbi:MAG: 6-phosphofructokinase [Alphaproteobacteria bacterium]|nr:6-phosphofructokinase [Alphaproteobacteria bacterium]
MSAGCWQRRYDALARLLPELGRMARPTLCGFSVCVDVYLRLEQADALLDAPAGTAAATLARELVGRAGRGVGGELHIDWPDGPAWLDARLPGRLGLGGTAAQAAQALAMLGAPSLLSLSDRSPRQRGLIDPAVKVATATGMTSIALVESTEGHKAPHYIFEFTAGTCVGEVVPPRSSRTIVRFGDDPLEIDPWFPQASLALAPAAGAGILSGFNEVPAAELESSLETAAGIARAWREAGLEWVHLELGDSPSVGWMGRVLTVLGAEATSLGLSLSELDQLVPDGRPVADRLRALAERLGLARATAHADHWAASVTTADPDRELMALMAGCLLAATRAEHGGLTVPEGCPPGAVFGETPLPPIARHGRWSTLCCPSPHLARPAATIGLGDTFLAGSLLVLGQARSPVPSPSLPPVPEVCP